MDDATKIRVQHCRDCGRRWQTTFAGCPYCGSTALTEDDVAGKGRVYSWVEVHRSLEDPPADVPYTVVTVDLDAGARVFGRYAAGAGPKAGEPVAMVSATGEDGRGPVFAPAGSDGA
jgi:hypothetical protein